MNHIQLALRALIRFNMGVTLAVATWLVWASSAVAFEPPPLDAFALLTKTHPMGACDCRSVEPLITVQRPGSERRADTMTAVARR